MPRYTIKEEIKNKTYYMHFSGIIETPLTSFLLIDDFKAYYLSEYNKYDWEDFLAGKRNMMTLDDAILMYNSNINKKLTKDQFIEKYMRKGDFEYDF